MMHRSVIGWLLAAAFLASTTDAAPLARAEGSEELAPRVVLGTVLGPDGSPARHALVTSGAGGRCLTDAEGGFRLELDVPRGARSVRVTALRGGGGAALRAHLEVALGGPGDVRAGTLALAPLTGCDPSWLPTFGAEPGTSSFIYALTVHDDGSGSGPALYAGGRFSRAGGHEANRIARWDGASWSPLGDGMNGDVLTLVSYDDGSGSGPQLVAGGEFTTAGGGIAAHLASWNGASWSPFGGGANDAVSYLAVHDDLAGGGPALYASGEFTSIGGVAATRIARWNGASWSPLGAGVQHFPVYATEIFDDGGGAELYAGGTFTVAGGQPAFYIAKWDGASWSTVGGGMSSAVYALAVHDDGTGGGPALYAAGGFTSAGGASAERIARWDGITWSTLGSGLSSSATSLTVHDDGSGSGPSLFVGGNFELAGGAVVNRMAKWDGSVWSALGSGIEGLPAAVYELELFDDGAGGGPALYAGGAFELAGGEGALNVAKWEAQAWSALDTGLDGVVNALAVDDAGALGAPALYAGGNFEFAGGGSANGVARFDGAAWSTLGSGVTGVVNALKLHDDGAGGGPALYVGGNFQDAGPVAAMRIARWNGASWSALGTGMGNPVDALESFDDGTGGGPALYAGGSFTSAGGVAAQRIARWNGAAWSAVGAGTGGRVRAFAVHDDGSGAGPALYVGGEFLTAGGASALRIARWTGAAWSALGAGMNERVLALAVFDDGGGAGPALYAGGIFTTAGGVAAKRLAKWDGAAWSEVGGGVNGEVRGLHVHDDGGGPALYVTGRFSLVGGGVSANEVAKWDGASWWPLGDGPSDGGRALSTYDDGSGLGPTLCVGGDFKTSPAGDSYLARWVGCGAPAGIPYCFGDGSGTPCPCSNQGDAGAGCAHSGGGGARLEGQGRGSVSADGLVLRAESLLPAQPALLFAGLNAIDNGDGAAFGDGLRCAGGSVVRLGVGIPNGGGTAAWGPGLGVQGGWTAGDTRRFQVWYRDPTASPCASGFNLTNGYEVAFTD